MLDCQAERQNQSQTIIRVQMVLIKSGSPSQHTGNRNQRLGRVQSPITGGGQYQRSDGLEVQEGNPRGVVGGTGWGQNPGRCNCEH